MLLKNNTTTNSYPAVGLGSTVSQAHPPALVRPPLLMSLYPTNPPECSGSPSSPQQHNNYSSWPGRWSPALDTLTLLLLPVTLFKNALPF